MIMYRWFGLWSSLIIMVTYSMRLSVWWGHEEVVHQWIMYPVLVQTILKCSAVSNLTIEAGRTNNVRYSCIMFGGGGRGGLRLKQGKLFPPFLNT